MTYRGKEKFTSVIGGFLTLVLMVIILSICGYKLSDLFFRSKTSIRKNTVVVISNSYTPPEVISEKNITVAFKLSNFWGEG